MRKRDVLFPLCEIIVLYVQGKGTLKKELTRYLRYQRGVCRPRTGRVQTRGKIPDMISIHQRPPEVNDRTIPGHWEGDLIIGAGNRSSMGTQSVHFSMRDAPPGVYHLVLDAGGRGRRKF